MKNMDLKKSMIDLCFVIPCNKKLYSSPLRITSIWLVFDTIQIVN